MRKAFLVLMIVALLFVFTVNGVVASSSIPIPGDANGDHTVNAADIAMIERMIFGDSDESLGADANQNGVIDMGDVVWVSRQILRVSPIYGDADENGTVNTDDIAAVIQMYLGIIPATPGADANQNGIVSMADAVYIQNMVK